MAKRRCGGPECDTDLSGTNMNRRYCTARCRERARQQRRTQTKKLSEFSSVTRAIAERVAEATGGRADEMVASFLARRDPEITRLRAQRGPAYQTLISSPDVLGKLMRQEITTAAAGEILGYDASTIRVVLEQLARDFQTDRAAAGWELSDDGHYQLGHDLEDRIAPAVEAWRADPADPALWELLDELTDRFVAFRNAHMTDEHGNPYLTKEFHRRWITSILWAIFTGSRQLILSPPRHGKTQLLIDFAIWLILRNPNIRILWIASNADLAKDWLDSMRDQFESNESLRATFLPPDQDFKPPTRSGRPWSSSQFSVDTRTVTGLKSPTMQAIGRSGRILSRDVDFMIVDDIEDDESTAQEAPRERTRKWFAVTAGSRKMKHTGVVVIGSRQDPQDLYSHLIRNDEWEVHVEEAHSSSCELDPEDTSLHTGCMLMPEINDYAWLMSQKRAFQITGDDATFEMVYLNKAVPAGLEVFSEEAMRSCLNRERNLGQYPPGTLLVAGLDPAVAGYQSAFLWGYHSVTQRLYVVDIRNDCGAGVEGFLAILSEWTNQYPSLHNWVVETNAFQRGYLTDRDVKAFQSRHGLMIEDHETQGNKHDKFIGVGAMGKLYKAKATYNEPDTNREVTATKVDLPYGDAATRSAVELYIAQALGFSSAVGASRSNKAGIKSDVLMASWFPQKVIRRWSAEWEAQMSLEYEQSFTSFGRTEWDKVPWSR